MEIKINLHLTVDSEIISLLTKLTGGSVGTPTKQMAPAPIKEDPAKIKGTVSVEELREAASKLMVTNKAVLKELLTKYNAKTVAALEESDYAGFLKDVKAVK